MESGFHISPDSSIRGPEGRTGWSVSKLEAGPEAVWGRAGDTGWRLAGGLFYEPSGAQTGYFVVAEGDIRVIHGPESKLPWM